MKFDTSPSLVTAGEQSVYTGDWHIVTSAAALSLWSAEEIESVIRLNHI